MQPQAPLMKQLHLLWFATEPSVEGDVGVAGGLQLTEPASEHVVLKDREFLRNLLVPGSLGMDEMRLVREKVAFNRFSSIRPPFKIGLITEALPFSFLFKLLQRGQLEIRIHHSA